MSDSSLRQLVVSGLTFKLLKLGSEANSNWSGYITWYVLVQAAFNVSHGIEMIKGRKQLSDGLCDIYEQIPLVSEMRLLTNAILATWGRANSSLSLLLINRSRDVQTLQICSYLFNIFNCETSALLVNMGLSSLDEQIPEWKTIKQIRVFSRN